MFSAGFQPGTSRDNNGCHIKCANNAAKDQPTDKALGMVNKEI